jgi:hypothetical protein
MNVRARQPDESFAEYRTRLAREDARDKRYLRGRVMWMSRVQGQAIRGPNHPKGKRHR